MDTIITSARNPAVKRLRKLISSGKARREANTYVAEGVHLVKSFLASGKTPLSYAYAASASEHPEIGDLLKELSTTSAEQLVLADSLFESVSSVHAASGILITFSPFIRSSAETSAGSALLLEDIQDPGNVGTILRTAAATGIGEAYLSIGCASPWSPKALRAGMGAQFGLDIRENADIAAHIKGSTAPVAATTLQPTAHSLYALDLTAPLSWLFGNEGQGVSQELLELCEVHVTIPQAESSVESLNVASAVAVCLYEQYRQRIS